MSKRSFLFVLLFLAPLLLCFPLVVRAQWEPNQRLTHDDSSSITSINNAWCVAAGPAGYVHVVWYDSRDGNTEIYYKRSTDFGASWDSSDTRLTYAPDSSLWPTIGVCGSFVHVAWVDKRDTLFRGAIYYKRSTDSGASWETDRFLDDVFGVYYFYPPSLTASGNWVHVVWDMDGDIHYIRSSDYGSSWGPPIILVSGFGAADFPSVVAVDSAVHVVWADTRSGGRKIYYKRSLDSGVSWSMDTLLSVNVDTRTPCIAASGSHVYVLWRGLSGGWWATFYQHSTDQGRTWSPETLLSRGRSIYPSVAASGPNVHGVWVASSTGTLDYRRSSDFGFTWSPDTSLTAARDFVYPSIAASGGSVHVVWHDSLVGNWEIYYKRNPTGNSGVEEASGRFQPLTSNLSISVFPNPFTSFTTLPGHSSERFTLYNISGRKVGVYKGDRIGWGVSSGVYFLRAEKGDPRPLRIVKLR
jgi:hypothetical protein